MGPQHPECPERLTAIDDQLIMSGLAPHIARHEAPAVTVEQLARVHDRRYVEAIQAAAPATGLRYLDPDTALCPHSVTAALHAAGAVVSAVDLVCGGEYQSAFCAVRPPGHHAESRRAMGFCVFNNIAVGAAHACAVHGLSRVAIVDFDVHHGNGTEEIFSDDPRVLMVSTFQYPLYPYSGVDDPAPTMVNIPLGAGSGSDEFREAVTGRWLSTDVHGSTGWTSTRRPRPDTPSDLARCTGSTRLHTPTTTTGFLSLGNTLRVSGGPDLWSPAGATMRHTRRPAPLHDRLERATTWS